MVTEIIITINLLSVIRGGWQGKESKKVDIRKHREGSQSGSLIIRGGVSKVMMMWERLRGEDCLRELVVLLSEEDQGFIEEGLLQEGIMERKRKVERRIGLQRHWYLNYMSADFYFPEYKMILSLILPTISPKSTKPEIECCLCSTD